MDTLTTTPPTHPDNLVRDKAIAYAFWFFLGTLGAHRFWWGKWKSALLMLSMFFGGVAIVMLGGVGVAVGGSFDSIGGALAGGAAALLGFALFGISSIWWLLDAVFILMWPARP